MSTVPSFNPRGRESESSPVAPDAQSAEAQATASRPLGPESVEGNARPGGRQRFSGPPAPDLHPRRCRGHQTEYNEILADAIYDAVRLHGHSDVAAAACYGVPAASIKRWLREHEDFAADLDAARAEFKEGIVKKIRYAKKRDGTLDWRARAWLLERTFPDEFGRPGKKAKPTDAEQFPDNPTTWDEALQRPPGSFKLTETLLVDLQRVHKAECMVQYDVEDRLRDRLADNLFAEWKHSQNGPPPCRSSQRAAEPMPRRSPKGEGASLISQAAALNVPSKPTTIDPHPRQPNKLRPPTQAEIDARNRMLAEFIAADGDDEDP